jgi:hypothetical protein
MTSSFRHPLSIQIQFSAFQSLQFFFRGHWNEIDEDGSIGYNPC